MQRLNCPKLSGKCQIYPQIPVKQFVQNISDLTRTIYRIFPLSKCVIAIEIYNILEMKHCILIMKERTLATLQVQTIIQCNKSKWKI